jgi:type IV pilus assembly protein PilM
MFTRKNKIQKNGTMLGLDLGTSQLKAAVVKRDGERLVLVEYAVRPYAVEIGKQGGEQHFANEIQELLSQLNFSERRAVVTISCPSAIICQTEFPRAPMNEVRSAIKLNTTRYLRRDFSDYCLDATELVDSGGDDKAKKSPKMRVLVGGASRSDVQWIREALNLAKVKSEILELAAVSVINAFQISHAEECANDTVLLVDIGSRTTIINFLRNGQPEITRITHFGGQQITEHVAQMLTLDPKVAEEEKVNMSEPVQALVKNSLSPLAREIRSSIDFFERQHDCHISKAFACGGTTRSAAILDFLSEEVGLRIESWDPLRKFDTTHFNGEGPKLMSVAPSLVAAIGAASSRL